MFRPGAPLLPLLAAASLAACAGAPPPNRPEVKKLDIEGNQAVPDKVIKARILTAATDWLPFSEKEYLDESVLETDLKRILRLYQAHGYYKAKVVERKVVPSGHGRVEVQIRIEEGPPTHTVDLLYEGFDDIPEVDRANILYKLPLREKAILTEAEYEETKDALLERLREAGFAEAEVHGLVQVELPKDEASVIISAETGPRYKFGEIFVAGANRVPRKKLIELARQDVAEGQLYSDSALNAAQTRIFDLGVFSAVKVTRGAPDRKEQTIPVVVNVREAPFRTLRLGGGLGVDPRRQEVPHLLTEWTSRNFYGGLRKLTVTGKLALVFIPSIFSSFNDPERRGLAGGSTVSFQQPEFLLRDLTLDTALEYERGVDQAFRYHAARSRLGVIYKVTRDFSITPSINYALFKISGAAEEALSTTTSRGQEALLDVCAQQGKLCLLSYFEERASFDQRDNPVEPSSGYFISLALQQGSHTLGGDFDYVRVLPEVRAYLPLGPHVLAGRLRAGVLIPREGQPSSVLTRFFLGGSTSERGYGNRNLSPKLVVPSTRKGQNAEELPIGGNGMLEGNVELRLNLPKNIGIVTFVDTGEVTESVSDLALNRLQVAVGVGLRYHTVFGPVRLDLAWRVVERPLDRFFSTPNDAAGNPLNPPPDKPGKLFGIQLPVLHFSIGEAY